MYLKEALLLKKYKYSPENYSEAIDTVINQCELWTDHYDTVDHPAKPPKAIIYRIEPQPMLMVAEEPVHYGEKKE